MHYIAIFAEGTPHSLAQREAKQRARNVDLIPTNDVLVLDKAVEDITGHFPFVIAYVKCSRPKKNYYVKKVSDWLPQVVR